jgi:two-component system, NtrC family, sensor histidine kinase PilS
LPSALPINSSYPEPDLLRKTRWLILWRLVLTTIILLLTVIIREKGGRGMPFPLRPVFWLVAFQYCTSLAGLGALLWGKRVKILAGLLLGIDGLAVSALVLFTGGLASFWIYLYFLVIAAAGILFYRPGGLAAAGYHAVLYGLVLAVHQGDWSCWSGEWLSAPSPYAWSYQVYQWGLAATGFFFVGFLSSLLPEQFSRQRSQLVQQQKDLHQLAEFNRQIIDNLDMGLITLDDRQQILSVNPAGRKILDLEEAVLQFMPLAAVLPQLAALPGWPESIQGQRFELHYQRPGGGSLYLGFSVTPLQEAPETGMKQILTFKDLTPIHEMEDQIRQMDRQAIMGQMAAGIVHEVKNPLASISGSIQMLREELREDGSGDRLLNLISREVDKLDTLLHDFLTFARPSQQAEQRIDLGDLIPGTLELIRKTKGVPPGIRWEIELERGLHLRIPPGEFSQILWNILINAVQAVPPEGLIRVAGRRLSAGRFAGGIEVAIEDNGPGIPPENLEKIFTPFFTTKEKGVGLGLSIVQKIMAQNSGLLRVQNRNGGGAQVLMVFPDPEKAR